MYNNMDLILPGLYIIGGEQGMGKSYLLKWIMRKLRNKLAWGIVFTNTFFDNNPFDYIPKEYVHPEYDEEILTYLMDMQEKLISEGEVYECFVIFDDAIDDENLFTSKALKRLSVQCRHYHISVFFCTQYPNMLPPRMRTNCMIVVIFQTHTEVALKALYKSYGQHFETFNDFKTFVMANTGDHKFIYYKKNTGERDINNLYKVMLCPKKIPEFKIKF